MQRFAFAYLGFAMPSLMPRERFLGCLIGQAVGDALGAPFEGLPADFVFWTQGSIDELIVHTSPEVLRYTDDTQMMIGVAETLVEAGEIRADVLGRCFVANYEPHRGYGPGARKIIESVAAGGDWNELAETIFPGGSFGNGAAMRAAPIGLLFGRDLTRVFAEAQASAVLTHQHPLGVEGAQLFAAAVALAAHGPPLDRGWFYDTLIERCTTEEFRWQLEAARELRSRHSVAFLGNSLPAHRSVVTAIACFTTTSSFESAMVKAIALGDDVDTLAAMAGALCGAHRGLDSIPQKWVDRLEGEPRGAAYLLSLGHALYERYRADAPTESDA